AGINDQWRGSVAVFTGPAHSMVTVDGTQSFDTLQFTSPSYTLQGGTLKIDPATGNDGTIHSDKSVVTINSILADGSGTNGLILTGNVVTLTGVNTYTGGTTIDGAHLNVSGNANLGAASSGVTLDNGGRLYITGSA